MSIGSEARATSRTETGGGSPTGPSRPDLPVVRACLIAMFAALIASLAGGLLGGLGEDFARLSVRTAIEVVTTLVTALAASLFWGRARRTAAQMDVLLAVSLALYAVVAFSFKVVPCLLAPDHTTFAGWAPMAAILLVVAMFVAAAWLPDVPLAQPRSRIRRLLSLGLLGVAVLVAVAATGNASIPTGRLSTAATGDLERDVVTNSTLAVGLQAFALALYAGAAVGLIRRAASRGDELLGWVAMALVLATAARIDFMVFPESWVGDLVGLAAFLTLLVGCAREVGSYQRRVAEAAVLQERRRMARDLHDGLAQELAYITVQSRRLAAGGSPERRRASDDLVSAAERALEESRLAIAALTRPTHEPLDRSMEDAGRSTAARAGIEVHFDIERDVEVAPEVRNALLRVMREAIGNAARHGEANQVWVTLRADRGLVLRIGDDGRGFDPEAPRRPDSMGLESMMERIEALGGKLLIDSTPGAGTRIEIELP